jgi:hypothetical protein
MPPIPPFPPMQAPQQQMQPNQPLKYKQMDYRDPYLNPYGAPEEPTIENTETSNPADRAPPTFEFANFNGREKGVVEHEVYEEAIVEAPDTDNSVFDLSSASVVEIKEENVFEEHDEIVIHGAEADEKSIWKPPVEEEEE